MRSLAVIVILFLVCLAGYRLAYRETPAQPKGDQATRNLAARGTETGPGSLAPMAKRAPLRGDIVVPRTPVGHKRAGLDPANADQTRDKDLEAALWEAGLPQEDIENLLKILEGSGPGSQYPLGILLEFMAGSEAGPQQDLGANCREALEEAGFTPAEIKDQLKVLSQVLESVSK